MVVKPTVPKEDRDEVLHRACSRLSAKVTAYPACRPGPVVRHRKENEGMDHDPLCPDASLTGGGCASACESCDDCQCDLIAKVRADERNRVFTHLDALADRDHTEGCPSLTCTGCADR